MLKVTIQEQFVQITTCVFDAYGTLFDVAAAARLAAAEEPQSAFAQQGQKLADIWRAKQLQYTWVRSITNAHTDFWNVTKDGLDFALESLGLHQDDALRKRLLQLYWELQAYPEVPQMLKNLKSLGLNTAILSNGSPDMLNGAVRSAGLEAYLDAVLSVESIGIFKPDTSVYDLVGKEFSCSTNKVLFVSSNGWDAAAASGYGFWTVWVNRAGDPLDRLPWKPQYIAQDLKALSTYLN